MTDHAERLRASLAGRYTIERELGRGGMATVYLARDLKHDRPVALEVLRPELAAVVGFERFLREIRLTAQLQHPRIPGDDFGLYLVTSDPSAHTWKVIVQRPGGAPVQAEKMPADYALHPYRRVR